MESVTPPPQKALTPTASKAMVDAFLTPLLQRLTEDAHRISPHYETLWKTIEKLYNAGGKRLRSYMTFLAFESFTDTPLDTILPAAVAQELIHTAMLIHDDIIDRDDMRYGVKNITREYLDNYEKLIHDDVDRRHYANSAAILAGDLLISEAYVLIAEANIDPSAILSAQKLISKAMFHVIGGELLDTEAVFRGANAADPLTIAEQKTASYSFVSPFLMGATLAGASQEQQKILQALGEHLGIAYQLRDDILGIFGDEAKTGKSVAGDIKEGKQTLLIKEFYLRAAPKDQQEFEALFGQQKVTKEGINRVKTLLTDSGAKEAVEMLITKYHDRALQHLDKLRLAEAHDKAFRTLIDLCLIREK